MKVCGYEGPSRNKPSNNQDSVKGCGRVRFRISYHTFNKPNKLVYCDDSGLCDSCKKKQEVRG